MHSVSAGSRMNDENARICLPVSATVCWCPRRRHDLLATSGDSRLARAYFAKFKSGEAPADMAGRSRGSVIRSALAVPRLPRSRTIPTATSPTRSVP